MNFWNVFNKWQYYLLIPDELYSYLHPKNLYDNYANQIKY